MFDWILNTALSLKILYQGRRVGEEHLKNIQKPIRNKRSILLSFSKRYLEHPSNFDRSSPYELVITQAE